jgi:hypothetical protein
MKVCKLYNYTDDDIRDLMKRKSEGRVQFVKRSNGEVRDMTYGFHKTLTVEEYREKIFSSIRDDFQLKFEKKKYSFLDSDIVGEDKKRLEDELGSFDYYRGVNLRHNNDMVEELLPTIKATNGSNLFINVPNLVGFNAESGRFFITSSIVTGDLSYFRGLISSFYNNLVKKLGVTLRCYRYVFVKDFDSTLKSLIPVDGFTGDLNEDAGKILDKFFNLKLSTDKLNEVYSTQKYILKDSDNARKRDDEGHRLICVYDIEKLDYRSVPLDGINFIDIDDYRYILNEST